MMKLAEREGLNIVEVREESHSAKESGQRPVFQSIIEDVKKSKFDGIVAWDASRLSRNAGDLGRVVDLMDQKLILDIRTHSQRFTNSPNDKFMLMILCSQAKFENDHKGENVKRGLRAKCERGFRPGISPLGYLHDKYADKGQKRVLLDEKRAPIIKQMFEKVAYENWSGRDIFKWLNQLGIKTRTGKQIHLSAIFRMLSDTYYYGEFEYPVGSQKWYQGAYDPIITKDLFLKTKANLLSPPKRHPGTKEFDFVRLFKCGACGSGICAEEKFKKLKNGEVHRYIYYHCSKSVDKECKQKVIREEELLKQLLLLIDKIDIDQIELRSHMEKELNKYRKFMYGVLGQETDLDKRQIDVDLRNYAKHVLVHGNKEEKRELVECIRSKIEIKDKLIYLKIY